jgi:uncharacterized protein YkwD
MRKVIFGLLFIGLIFLSGCSQPEQIQTDNISKQQEINIHELERQIHELINIEREKKGLALLEWDLALANIARDHSKDMANNFFFDHNNLEDCDPACRAKKAGYVCRKSLDNGMYSEGVAENIFKNDLYTSFIYNKRGILSYNWNTQEGIAALTVSGWMNSTCHRENILASNYDTEGIGVYISSETDKVFVTQNFC